MRARLMAVGLVLWLAGCATPPPPATPAVRELPVASRTVLVESLDLLMARGYVIRHADAELGRLEAVIARWPGYRVRLEVQDSGTASRVAMTAYRGNRPLPPSLVEPLLTELNSRLEMAR